MKFTQNKFKASNNKLPPTYKEKDSKQVTEVVAKKKVLAKKINFVGELVYRISVLYWGTSQRNKRLYLGQCFSKWSIDVKWGLKFPKQTIGKRF